MIAAASKKEDQILASNQLRSLIDAAHNFVDEDMFNGVEGAQFMIPMLHNKHKQSAFWQMNEDNKRVLFDIMLKNVEFVRLIRE